MLPEFEALRLNLGTSDVATQRLIEADTWARIEGDAPRSGPCVWGLDLGTSAAQSAIASFWPDTGALDVLAAFPERPALAERGLARWGWLALPRHGTARRAGHPGRERG